MESIKSQPRWLSRAVVAGALIMGSASAVAIVTDLSLVELLHENPAGSVPGEEFRIDQLNLNSLPQGTAEPSMGDPGERFGRAFLFGDEFFEFTQNVIGGAGTNVGDGSRFTRVPKADLTRGSDLSKPRQWLDHLPERSTGPNGQSCIECHNRPFGTFAGNSAVAAHRDPLRLGDISKIIRRYTPHLAGSGALQLLVQEMTEKLHRIRDRAGRLTCRDNDEIELPLNAKGVRFGRIEADPDGYGSSCVPEFNYEYVKGVDHDLVVKPYQWKGSDVNLRNFNRSALHNELGIQATELIVDKDSDGDGVINEATVGDVTGLVTYIAGQPRPTTKLELNDLGDIVPALTSGEIYEINFREKQFRKAKCATCHKPKLILKDPMFKVQLEQLH